MYILLKIYYIFLRKKRFESSYGHILKYKGNKNKNKISTSDKHGFCTTSSIPISEFSISPAICKCVVNNIY